jgi:lipid-A-disaccharide synthase
MSFAADILILSNGPGELTTWVRPVVEALQNVMGDDRPTYRVSLVLSPCPNASGKEVEIARRYPGIDRIQGAEHFFPFLLFGKTAEDWDWYKQGVVVFLGGDQVYPILIGKRLGYRTIIYGEWDTRWHRWGDRYAVMNDTLIQKVPKRYAHKFTVIGDLMASAAKAEKAEDSSQRLSTDNRQQAKEHPHSLPRPSPRPLPPPPTSPQIGFLPGSKSAKLA